MGANECKSAENVTDSTRKTVSLCAKDDLKNGEMKDFEVDGSKLLLIRDDDQFFAVGAKCSHYGSPLVTGSYCDGRIRCSWHGACFNVKTGDIEDFPGLDSLPKYEVSVVDNQVQVHAAEVKVQRRVKQMIHRSDKNKTVFLIIGGGGAAATCVEILRQEGYDGRIILATKEKHLPYDRPKLSKSLNSSGADLALRKKEDYQQFGIEIKVQSEATHVDCEAKVVKFKDGESVKFDKLMIATGGSPNDLDIDGKELRNILILRSPEDGNVIATQSKDKRVVIIGSSFIGLEVAAYLCDKASSVTVVGRSETPLQKVFGDKIGSTIQKMLENKGVKFICNNFAKKFIGNNGSVKQVVLSDDTLLDCDVCILGVGVHPATKFLQASGLNMSPQGHVIVNKHLSTNKSDIFAGGDIVQFPLFLAGDDLVNIQHWQMAGYHGRVCALNMLGKSTEVRSVPFFWSMILGKSVRFTGYNSGYDDVIIHGSLDDLKFAAFYTKGDMVVGVASLNFDPIVANAAQTLFKSSIKKSSILSDPYGFLKTN